jgi:hypothetical protein
MESQEASAIMAGVFTGIPSDEIEGGQVNGAAAFAWSGAGTDTLETMGRT